MPAFSGAALAVLGIGGAAFPAGRSRSLLGVALLAAPHDPIGGYVELARRSDGEIVRALGLSATAPGVARPHARLGLRFIAKRTAVCIGAGMEAAVAPWLRVRLHVETTVEAAPEPHLWIGWVLAP